MRVVMITRAARMPLGCAPSVLKYIYPILLAKSDLKTRHETILSAVICGGQKPVGVFPSLPCRPCEMNGYVGDSSTRFPYLIDFASWGGI
ncbi:MAG: hypothetical protein K2H52_02125 [Lachnospiraceae bacterium]|nr:hypothetical protein [Lachnospiraceae bacterium]